MIKSVTVTNYLGKSVKMILREPEKSGFLIKSITGLGAGKADINTTEIASNDGSIYTSGRITERNIVMKIKLMQLNATDNVLDVTDSHKPYTYIDAEKALEEAKKYADERYVMSMTESKTYIDKKIKEVSYDVANSDQIDNLFEEE